MRFNWRGRGAQIGVNLRPLGKRTEIDGHPRIARGAARRALVAALSLSLLAGICPICRALSTAQTESHAQSPEAGSDIALVHVKELIREGKFSDADAALLPILRQHDDSATAHMLLGLVKYQEDRPAESLAEFTRAAQLSPPRASELVVVALDYVKLKDLANADRWMTMALDKAPTSVAAWRYLGGIKYSENRFSEAIGAYKRCIELQPEDVLAEDGLGRSYEGLSRNEDAAAAYRKALDWQSATGQKHEQPLLHLGSLLIRQGQAESAMPYLEAAENLAPGDAGVHQQLGEGYTKLNQVTKAQAELEKAIELSPNDSHLHWLIASVYRKLGLTEKADEESRKFSALVGSHSNDETP